MSETLEILLSRCGLKVTPARSALLEVLAHASNPLSYEQIKIKMPQIMHKTTFSRNMAKFEASGLVCKFESDDRKWYFELATSVHAHFICEECHHIQCIDIPFSGVEGDVKSIVLKGRCKECQV